VNSREKNILKSYSIARGYELVIYIKTPQDKVKLGGKSKHIIIIGSRLKIAVNTVRGWIYKKNILKPALKNKLNTVSSFFLPLILVFFCKTQYNVGTRNRTPRSTDESPLMSPRGE
jgi:hypothetical protein